MTSPTNGTRVSSSTVAVTGTSTPGARIDAEGLGATGGVAGTASTVADGGGNWSLVVPTGFGSTTIMAARVSSSRDAGTRTLAVGLAGAFTWYLVQGLGENFGLIGEAHMTPLLGALLGTLCARFDCAAVKHEHSTEPVRSLAAPSAVPAL